MALQRSRAPPPRGVLLKAVLSLFSVLDVGFWNLGWEIEREGVYRRQLLSNYFGNHFAGWGGGGF